MTVTGILTPRQLGRVGPTVFPIALGAMGMSSMYGASDDEESIATIHEAIDRGVTLIDTGDFYGIGHNELLIGRAIRDRRDKVLLSVKFGAQRAPDHSWIGYDTRPVAAKNALAHTLTRLGVDHISTSTGRRASIPQCRSKTPSARLPRWCRPATCAPLGCRRLASRPFAARTPCTRLPTSRSSTRS